MQINLDGEIHTDFTENVNTHKKKSTITTAIYVEQSERSNLCLLILNELGFALVE